MFMLRPNVITSLVAGCALLVLQAHAADTPAAAPAPTAPPAAAPKPLSLFDDVVIAKGKGVEVKRGDLDTAMVSLKSTAAARGQTIPPQQLELIEQQVLDRLIQIELLLA